MMFVTLLMMLPGSLGNSSELPSATPVSHNARPTAAVSNFDSKVDDEAEGEAKTKKRNLPNEATVPYQGKPAIEYSAQILGDYLVIRAKHDQHWHTYAMDNERRAIQALAGKESLGIEQGLEIQVKGLEFVEPWRQTEPSDFSKPEMRWYSFGFNSEAIFVRKFKPAQTNAKSKPILIRIRGQACSDQTCIGVNVTLVPKVLTPDPETESVEDQLAEVIQQTVPVQLDANETKEPTSEEKDKK